MVCYRIKATMNKEVLVRIAYNGSMDKAAAKRALHEELKSGSEDIQNKICRVVIDDENNILASAAVYVGDEPTYHEIYNGAWQTENKIYGIVHRIMAANHAKKRGAASFLMTYCAKLSLEAGVTSMRCDTHPGNIIMQHTLEKNGYIRCGIIHLTDGADRFAYEKVLK